MKVLYIVPDGDDLGGIYTSTENLLCGFREAGHMATFALLRPTKTMPVTRPVVPRLGSYVGEGTGYHLHPQYGWQGAYYSLGVAQSITDLVKLGNAHDVIIWGAMFGLRNGMTEGTTDWLRLFKDIKKPHVCMIRDDHLPDRYPWVAVLERYGVVGWACVQRSSFDSCVGLSKPRAIIYSGHDIGDIGKHDRANMKNRTETLFMCHTFKSWKRADRLVAAVPYLPKRIHVALGGQGIEYYYMASDTKCKPRYFCTAQNDPDAPKSRLGKPIWKNALDAGMRSFGNITATQRDACLRKSMFFVDLSWRPHSTGQINRTIVEAIKRGCVPICNNRFITGRDDGEGELFRAGVHYLDALGIDCTPKQLAARLTDCFNLTEKQYAAMQKAGLALIQQFDRRTAAQGLVALACGKKVKGTYDANEKGGTPLLMDAGRTMFKQTFGELPR